VPRTGDVVSDFADSATSVCLVTDIGRINDGSFNESAYNGMVAAATDFNLNSTFIETQSQADYEKDLQTCLDEGYSVIVTVGFLIANATQAAAEANPDVFFIGVDQFFAEPIPNLVGIQFREDQAGFLAGVMAALVTESDMIGGIYGEEIPPVVKFRHGFEQGAKYINPEIEIFGVYVGSFIDQPAGRETAENLIGEGVDVIFGAGGPTGSAGIQAAAERGVKVIGVDQDEYFTTFGGGETPGAENIITSAVKRVDQGVYDMLAALTAGTVAWPDTSLYLMDAAVAGVGFAPANDATVPAEVTAQVEDTLAMLAAGELETGVDPVTGAMLEPTE
jgi:basic membrane protein A and related proteins